MLARIQAAQPNDEMPPRLIQMSKSRTVQMVVVLCGGGALLPCPSTKTTARLLV